MLLVLVLVFFFHGFNCFDSVCACVCVCVCVCVVCVVGVWCVLGVCHSCSLEVRTGDVIARDIRSSSSLNSKR